MPVSKILVGIDHSDRSDKALRRANGLALFHDAQLVLDYAVDVGTAERLRGLIEKVALEETEERAKKLLGEAAALFEARTTKGRPFEALRDAAAEVNADLIVIGVHRQDGAMFGLSGSTARRLLNVAEKPVLVVTGEPGPIYENVIVGFDGSPASVQALRFARELAPNSNITIVTAAMIPFSARKQERYLVEQFEEEARRKARETLGEEMGGITLLARVGEAYGVIREVLQERKPDLLALGTSMPGIYRSVFGGGIVDLIAADPPCDLLVTKV